MRYLLIVTFMLLIQPVKALQLNGQVTTSNQIKPIEASTKFELGALGIEHTPYGLITYVDPGSYLYGTFKAGDLLYSINGVPLTKAMKSKINYGDDQSEVTLGILKYPESYYYIKLAPMPEGQKTVHLHYYLCHRSSLNNMIKKDLAQGLVAQYQH